MATTIVAGHTNVYRLGFNSGVVTEIKLNKRFSVLPELIYSLKGNTTSTGIFNENYINFPLLLNFKLIDRLSAVAGPEFGYLLNANTKSGGVRFEATDEFRRFDLGLVAGLRYKIGKKWGADFRYIWNLRPRKTIF